MKRLYQMLAAFLARFSPPAMASESPSAPTSHCLPCEYSLNLDATRFSNEGNLNYLKIGDRAPNHITE
ncbi:hypothetical protein QVN42_12820 [Yersinia nurmii]|uniref:Uncharacterized protein n=1 Tax=Yersinia nurmii TaxID=685706 RepID=A0AAW7K3X9_9GAMM|nr:hypothetical protein [Yersinia nurmii]MDN0088262.1 hypothetical protein [Yersinia nurmii]CNE39274.1 Uncharacterised protein [Yersinia nurmii]